MIRPSSVIVSREPGPSLRETAIVFEGTLDRTGKHLVLDRVKAARDSTKDSGDMRILVAAQRQFRALHDE